MNQPGATTADIEFHYDIGLDFYRLFLDDTLAYSCALWPSPGRDDLLEAQLSKLGHHLDALRLPPGGRLLDVGCGWGALLRAATARVDLAGAVGLTLSKDQYEHCRSLGPPVEVHLADWRDHRPDERYDGIACVGALEHFVRPTTARRERRERYREFFRTAAGWADDGGRLSLQTITVGHQRLDQQALADTRFVMAEIFPGSMLPRVPELMEAFATGFELHELRTDRSGYARTCRAWHERLQARRARADEIAGPEVTARYLRYFTAAARMFDHGHLTLLRVVGTKR